MTTTGPTLVDAYSGSAGAWRAGPEVVYDRLAEVLVARSPVALAGAGVLDVGAGTGAASRAARAAGARWVVAADPAFGMVSLDARRRPPAVTGDARHLPFRDGAFDAAVAAFSLNHLGEPALGLREMARVTRPGGALLASSYAADDNHPVKAAVEAALDARGWRPQPWFVALRADALPVLATVEGFRAAAAAAGLEGEVEAVRVGFPELGPAELVAWRLGMAQHASFVAKMTPPERAELANEAAGRLGAAPVLVRSVLVFSGVRR